MRDCKMKIAGHDREVEFVCERCAVGADVDVQSVAGRMQRFSKPREAGVCVSCKGEKRVRGKVCLECGGSGVCPECNGHFSRRWSKLPITAQSNVLSRLAHGEDLLLEHAIVRDLYRER